jgi:6-phosphogluconolactonase
MVDERCVPEDDARSNFRFLRETLLDHVPVPGTQVHSMRAANPRAAQDYEEVLRSVLGGSGRAGRSTGALDVVLLGIGTDGHTASLFPHSPALAGGGDFADRWVLPNAGPTVTPPDRITLGARFINQAGTIAVLATGAAKREAVGRLAAAAGNVDETPIRVVREARGELRFYLDEAAMGVTSASG